MSTIAELVEAHGDDRGALVAALIYRENEALDLIRLAGMQFGLFPQVVAEVLAETGLGTPLSEQERAMIHEQFVTLMQGGGNAGGGS